LAFCEQLYHGEGGRRTSVVGGRPKVSFNKLPIAAVSC
jgi:hypothetical protein